MTVVTSPNKLFSGPCDFVWGAASLDQLPEPDLPEVAFVGRSNVGKSSLLNALTGRKSLARTSMTPGRTQQLNFFNLADTLMLVDLPGYGYAKASKGKIKSWTALVNAYLKGRANLKQAVVLVDARHGLKDSDLDMFKMLDGAAVAYVCVLTKADKVKPGPLAAVKGAVEAVLKSHPAAFPEVYVTSSQTQEGMETIRGLLARHIN